MVNETVISKWCQLQTLGFFPLNCLNVLICILIPQQKISIFKATKCKGAYETPSAVLQSIIKMLYKMLVESIKLHFRYGGLTFSKCFGLLKRSLSLRSANY